MNLIPIYVYLEKGAFSMIRRKSDYDARIGASITRKGKSIVRDLTQMYELGDTDLDDMYALVVRKISEVSPDLEEFLVQREARVEESKLVALHRKDTAAPTHVDIRRIRRKLQKLNMYPKKLEEVVNILFDFDPVVGMHMCVLFDKHRRNPSSVITDDIWCIATYYALYAFNMEKCEDFVWDLPSEEDEQFQFFYILCLFLSLLVLAPASEKTEIEAVKQKDAKEMEVLQEKVRRLETQVCDLSTENSALKATLRSEVNKAIIPLEQTISKQQKELQELQAELDFLRELRSVEENEDCTEDTQLLELPPYAVFIGGHNILQTKLRSLFPNWKILSCDDKKADVGETDIIFLYTDYISHSQFKRVKGLYAGKLVYCYGTNLDILTDSMRKSYTQFMLGTSKH